VKPGKSALNAQTSEGGLVISSGTERGLFEGTNSIAKERCALSTRRFRQNRDEMYAATRQR
jgi:hypothetical protein